MLEWAGVEPLEEPVGWVRNRRLPPSYQHKLVVLWDRADASETLPRLQDTSRYGQRLR